MGKIIIVGLGPGERDWMLPAAERALANTRLVICAKRNLPLITQNPNVYVMDKLSDAMIEIAAVLPEGDVAVCCSGDPGMYSLLARVKQKFPDEDVQVISGIGSLQILCDRIGEGREKAVVLSAHGRDLTDGRLIGAIAHNEQTLILLDDKRSVAWLCETLLHYGMDSLEIAVGENLSYSNQRVVLGSPRALLREQFSPLSAVRVYNKAPNPIAVNFGLRDDAFARGDSPMTKSEVRAVALSKLDLRPDSTLWDIGAGTGSVSVEAARLLHSGMVLAIERDAQALSLIAENKRRFRLPNLQIVAGSALSVIESLPAPTEVFIGGSGGELPEIIGALAAMNRKIRVVVTAVTLETQAQATELLNGAEFSDFDAACIAVSTAKKAREYHIMAAQNAVTLFSALLNGGRY